MKNRLYANVCTWAEKITKNKISKLLLLWKVSKNIFFNSNSLFYFSAFCIHVCICVYVCTPWIEPWNFTFIIIFFFSHWDVFCLQALFFFSLAFHTHTTYEKGSIHSFFFKYKKICSSDNITNWWWYCIIEREWEARSNSQQYQQQRKQQ